MTALRINYGPTIERSIQEIEAAVAAAPAIAAEFPSRWLALELLENGGDIRRRLSEIEGGNTVAAAASSAYRRLEAEYGEAAPVAVVGARYDWIHDTAEVATVTKPAAQLSRSDQVDRVLTHPVAGLGFFLFALWAVFKLTADIATFFLDWIDVVVNGPIARWVASLVGAVGLGNTWIEDLMVSGVVAGVGGILVFLPVLLSLYLALAVLEDSGYMARGALVMDRLMRRLGLPAKSFLPMLVGFGCTVPAIYATRTLERRRDRVLTGLLVPFMSCGARLPVYVLMAAAFFPTRRGLIVFAMYVLGVLVALVVGVVLSRTVLHAESTAPLLLELPPYRRPTWQSVWFHTWVRIKAFVRDAGTIILGTSIVLWLLLAIPVGAGGDFGDTPIEESLFGRTAEALAPVFEPAGFGSAEATGALATGFVAKEVVISSLAQLYGTENDVAAADPSFGSDVREIVTGFGSAVRNTILAVPGIIGVDMIESETDPADDGLLAAVQSNFDQSSGGHGALAALAFCVFVLLYTPCMAAVAASRRELGAGWMWTSVIGQTALAWVMAVAVFQFGRASGLG
ncbi:MAG: ferrous iron transport protein B [Acidimicrobiia bacterium]|nr:ferrous iron transport protein B [Acidimicrobiia bacterium]